MNVGIIIRHCDAGLRQVFETAAKNGFHHGQLVSWDPQYWTEENALDGVPADTVVAVDEP